MDMLQEQQTALDEGEENVFLQRSWNNFKFVWGSEFACRVTHSKIFFIQKIKNDVFN